jgi:hypothetical protein
MDVAGNTSDLASRMANVRRARKTNPQRGDRQYGRSSITNGDNLLRDVDGRSPLYRRYRDIANAILADQAGVDQCSEARKQLIRRFAAAAVLAEQLESRLANGEQINISEHATLSSTLVRLAQRIGIDRVPKEIGGLTLGDLMRLDIEERQREAANAPAVELGNPEAPSAEAISEAPEGAEGHASDGALP